jgi:hypothetical protein|tara:strand:+ start:107 stop:334 length:228 start_codon:yes stop_codon:yes gene_type:complete
MDVPPVFPNSVNAPSEVVVRDRIQKLIRLDQISRIRTDKVEATTEYSETYYYYKNGEVLSTIVKVEDQFQLDIRA